MTYPYDISDSEITFVLAASPFEASHQKTALKISERFFKSAM